MSERCLYDKVIDAGLEVRQEIVPLLEAYIVITSHIEHRIRLEWIAGYLVEPLHDIIIVVGCIHYIPQVQGYGTEQVGAIGTDKVLPMVAIGGDMTIGTYIHAVVLYGCLERNKGVLCIIPLRISKANVGAGRSTHDIAHQIQTRLRAASGEEGCCPQEQ